MSLSLIKVLAAAPRSSRSPFSDVERSRLDTAYTRLADLVGQEAERKASTGLKVLLEAYNAVHDALSTTSWIDGDVSVARARVALCRVQTIGGLTCGVHAEVLAVDDLLARYNREPVKSAKLVSGIPTGASAAYFEAS